MGWNALKLHFQGEKYCIFFSFRGATPPWPPSMGALYLHFRIFFLPLCPSLRERSGLGQDLAELCFCLCFRCPINYQAAFHSDFSPKNGLIPIFLHWLKLKKKASFNGNSSLRKRRGSLKEPSQTRQKRKKTLRTSPPQPWLDLSFLTAEIHQRECRLVHRLSTANSQGKAVMLWTNGCFYHLLSFCPPPTWPPASRSTIRNSASRSLSVG